MTRKDPVSAELHAAVLVRDRMCVRAKIEPHVCRDIWGVPHDPDDLAKLQLDHVQEGYGRMGKRAPSDLAHLVAIDAGSHLRGWATSHRADLRDYLASVNEHTHVEPDR